MMNEHASQHPHSAGAPHGQGRHSAASQPAFGLRLVAWEVTRSCNLSCIHCRAAAQDKPYENELTTAECFQLLDNIATFASPIIILTGGEPLLRPDIFEIASYGNSLGFRMTMAVNGTMVTSEVAAKMKKSGIQRVSISIDGATAASHDAFRQVKGAFDGALGGIALLKETGLDFQINTSITQHNLHEIKEIQKTCRFAGCRGPSHFPAGPHGTG